MDTVDFGILQADGGNHAGIGDLAVGGDAGFGHVEDSVGAASHTSSNNLGEAADIVGQSGAPYRLVGALEKLVQIQGLAGGLINHCIGLFLGYEEMESINIAVFDAGVATWSGGRERVLQAQRVAVCCGVIVIRLYKIWWRTTEQNPQGCW